MAEGHFDTSQGNMRTIGVMSDRR